MIADRDGAEELKALGPPGLEVIATRPHRRRGLVLLHGQGAGASGAR